MKKHVTLLQEREKPAHAPIPLDPKKHHVLGWKDCKYIYEDPVQDLRCMT